MSERLPASLWARYQLEMEGIECFEYRWGLAAFRVDGQTFHLIEFFIDPDKRDGTKRKELIDILTAHAKERGCTHIVGQADLKIRASTRRVSFWLRMGAEIYSAKQDIIYFIKRI